MIHIKGIKPAIQLPDLFGSKKELSFEVTFTDDMKYEEPGNEGADFRKLTGLSLNRWNYHKDACLIGWRYWKGEFQLVPYLHFKEPRDDFDNKVGSYAGYFNNGSIQGFKSGDKVSGVIHFSDGRWTIKLGDRISTYSHGSDAKKAFRIMTWFGGTCPPSKTFSIPLKLKRFLRIFKSLTVN